MIETPKEKILKTAARMFQQKGYAATTLRAIAVEHGTSHVNVLYHYSSKAEIAKAYLNIYYTAMNAELNRICNEHGIRPSMKKMLLFWTIHYCTLAVNPQLANPYLEIIDQNRNIVYDLLMNPDADPIQEMLGEENRCEGTEIKLKLLLTTDLDYRIVSMLNHGEITINEGLAYMLDAMYMFFLHENPSKNKLQEDIDAVFRMIDGNVLNAITDMCLVEL